MFKPAGCYPSEMKNFVRQIYDRYSEETVAKKIAELVYPKSVAWEGELEILSQSRQDENCS